VSVSPRTDASRSCVAACSPGWQSGNRDGCPSSRCFKVWPVCGRPGDRAVRGERPHHAPQRAGHHVHHLTCHSDVGKEFAGQGHAIVCGWWWKPSSLVRCAAYLIDPSGIVAPDRSAPVRSAFRGHGVRGAVVDEDVALGQVPVVGQDHTLVCGGFWKPRRWSGLLPIRLARWA